MTQTIETLKPTYKTTPFLIAVGCVVLAPFYMIGVTWLCAAANLSPADADLIKKPMFAMWALVGSSGAVGAVIGALKNTFAKNEVFARTELSKAENPIDAKSTE